MKRLLLLVIGACLMCLAFGLTAAEPVAPYGDPAPGVIADDYACYPTGVLPVDVAVGDYNADGWADIAVLSSATGQVMYFDNYALASPGVFAIPALKVPGIDQPRFATAADLELAVGGNYVLYGASPTLGLAQRNGLVNYDVFAIPATTTGILTADLNHDTLLDIILLSKNSGVGATAGITTVFAPITSAGGPGAFYGTAGDVVAGALGDLNGDSWTDVAVITKAGTIEVFYNLPYGGALSAAAVIPAGRIGIETLTDIAIGDFNADGLNDLVVVGTNPPEVNYGLKNGYAQVFVNTLSVAPIGAVGFEEVGEAMQTWGFNAVAVEVLDADGNGRDDFAVANKGSATVTVFLADALPELLADGRAKRVDYCLPQDATDKDLIDIGFWLFKYELQCGYFPVALDSADFDWNGKADLVVVLQSQTESLNAQDASCIEIIFDVACGFYPAGNEAPAQRQHTSIPNVQGELDSCEPCTAGEPCSENNPPRAEIDVEGDSGNP